MSAELSRRRHFLKKAAIIAAGALIVSPLIFAKSLLNSEEKKEEEVSPNEDLMREHGVLRRIILIYREAIHRIQDNRI